MHICLKYNKIGLGGKNIHHFHLLCLAVATNSGLERTVMQHVTGITLKVMDKNALKFERPYVPVNNVLTKFGLFLVLKHKIIGLCELSVPACYRLRAFQVLFL